MLKAELAGRCPINRDWLRVLCGLCGHAVFVALAAATSVAQSADHEIVKVAGNVYRYTTAGYNSAFLVTPAGIIVTDPMNTDAATWLKTELKTRFNQPVKYVIYSHSHADHASGGEVFSDTATFVSHELTKATMVADKVPTPLAQETFKDSQTIELGGSSVELTYVGPNHGDGMIAMRFPRERVLFAVDFIPVMSIGYRDFPGAHFPGWLDSLKRVDAMDFDILVPGHGAVGNKAHVRMHRDYLDDLIAQVTRFVKEGKSVEEAKKLVDLTKYKAWGSYNEMRDLNIEGMYRIVRGQ